MSSIFFAAKAGSVSGDLLRLKSGRQRSFYQQLEFE